MKEILKLLIQIIILIINYKWISIRIEKWLIILIKFKNNYKIVMNFKNLDLILLYIEKENKINIRL